MGYILICNIDGIYSYRLEYSSCLFLYISEVKDIEDIRNNFSTFVENTCNRRGCLWASVLVQEHTYLNRRQP